MELATSLYGVSVDVSLSDSFCTRKEKTMLATRPDIDTIAITRTFDGIEAAAHRVIADVGGMTSVVKGAKIAVLKPNFVAGRSAAPGSATSFALLKAVAEEERARCAGP